MFWAHIPAPFYKINKILQKLINFSQKIGQHSCPGELNRPIWTHCPEKNKKNISQNFHSFSLFSSQDISVDQCDRIGRLLKVLVDNFFIYVWRLLGYFENTPIKVKTAVVTFLSNFRKNWAAFLIHYLVTLPTTSVPCLFLIQQLFHDF